MKVIVNKFQKTGYGYFLYYADVLFSNINCCYIFERKKVLELLKEETTDKDFLKLYNQTTLTLYKNIVNRKLGFITQIGLPNKNPEIKDFDTLKEAKNHIKEYITLQEI